MLSWKRSLESLSTALLVGFTAAGALAAEPVIVERVPVSFDEGEFCPPGATPDHDQPPPYADGPYGLRPHKGKPWYSSAGYPHYDAPAKWYDIWFRPRAFGLTKKQRCRPDRWDPRGFGHLFNRSDSCYRMDYNRYVVVPTYSEYGPSYYRQLPPEQCPWPVQECADGTRLLPGN